MTSLVVLAAVLIGAAAVAFALFAGVRRLLTGSRTVGGAEIHTPTDDTTIDADGAVRSVQTADIVVDEDAMADLWHPANLERLARTYWSYLSRCTLGLVRVYYTEGERYVCLLHPRLKLLTFEAPEYEMSADRGIVRWRIKEGLLVAEAGRGGNGYLELDVRRLDCDEPGRARLRVEVEVANFYPAIASRIGRFIYANTQSRIHVIVCHGFLRRLVKRNLDESVTGRFAAPAPQDIPEPRRERERPGAPA